MVQGDGGGAEGAVADHVERGRVGQRGAASGGEGDLDDVLRALHVRGKVGGEVAETGEAVGEGGEAELGDGIDDQSAVDGVRHG